ncbi:MAG: hypothetical protein AAEC10_07080, partial [Rhodospirillales bacterium]
MPQLKEYIFSAISPASTIFSLAKRWSIVSVFGGLFELVVDGSLAEPVLPKCWPGDNTRFFASLTISGFPYSKSAQIY